MEETTEKTYTSGKSAVIVANGKFPVHPIPLKILHSADFIIACDGAVKKLVEKNLPPNIIIGDLDSISKKLKLKFSDRIIEDHDQYTNDLTKSVTWAKNNGFDKVTILSATGKREDHTLGNISLLYSYSRMIEVEMVTNKGVLKPIRKTTTLKCEKGQQISIFSNHPDLKITSQGLKYPLQELQLRELWMGTLNEALNDNFTLEFKDGEVIVFFGFDSK
jgi:thiamine pyrophosphokinase